MWCRKCDHPGQLVTKAESYRTAVSSVTFNAPSGSAASAVSQLGNLFPVVALKPGTHHQCNSKRSRQNRNQIERVPMIESGRGGGVKPTRALARARSLSASLPLSASLSLCLSLSLSLCLSVSLLLSLARALSLPLSLPLSLFLSRTLSLSRYFSLSLSPSSHLGRWTGEYI